jgi:hypothetical protein
MRLAPVLFVMSVLLSTAGADDVRRSDDTKNSMNCIMVIFPYKHQGTWVFDDDATGLVREPFVAGIDTMIDRLVADVPGAEEGFKALFSAVPFPGHSLKLEWRRSESGGNWYYAERFGMEGWLCPALFKYFPKAPLEIYVRAEAKRP